LIFCFFFQAEDGIRDVAVTGVQTCALPIHIGGMWDPTNNLFWVPKPYPSWVKNVSEKRWQSPIGDAPDLTTEQSSQNNAGTNKWYYNWNEDAERWDLTDDS